MKKIAIIGAGASGLLLANLLDTNRFAITLFEKNNKLGKKLQATGNGKCNITNANLNSNNFHSHTSKFVNYALGQFDYHKCKKIFSSLGIEFITLPNGKAYPMSQTASSVVDQLKFPIENSKIDLQLNCTIKKISKYGDQFILDNQHIFDIVVLACGSIAMEKLGGTDLGYTLSQQLGHTITPLYPSLVQLICDDSNISLANGIKIVATYGHYEGDLLFTKYGVSGNLILDISSKIAKQLQCELQVAIDIDLMPDFTKDQLLALFSNRLKNLPPRPTQLWFDGIINQKLALYILKKTNLDYKSNSNQLNKKDLLNIVHTLKKLQLNIIGTKGFENSEVCSGGVSLEQIDNTSMQSKIHNNLYIIGELMDVDGDCGGFNLHWAWASAYVCAQSIQKKG
ncbi:MAG: aminoacetone oxidase family FAD-binding enzyme [Campylobacterales bacterium]|nr:aminoacetone oxidase family FAD-binding enzyme [Campylobacterales bacterium]